MDLKKTCDRPICLLAASVTVGLMSACQPHAVMSHSDSATHGSHAAEANSGHHSGEAHHSAAPRTQAILRSPSSVSPNQPISLTIDIQDAQGQAVSQFERFQEQLMHLIVVSDDLHHFDHIHPEYQQNGRFKITTTLPRSGGYTLFSDYKPAQQPEIVSTLKLQATGPVPVPPPVDFQQTQTVDDLTARLVIAPAPIKSQQAVTLTFQLKDSQTRQPVTDLQPYLGEQGHLVILRRSPALSRADYIHAHALPRMQDGQVQFQATFPQPGQYKLWGQFNRKGQIITVGFWVEVTLSGQED